MNYLAKIKLLYMVFTCLKVVGVGSPASVAFPE